MFKNIYSYIISIYNVMVPHTIMVNTILDRVFNYFTDKFGSREIYDENIYSRLHKEFIVMLLNHYYSNTDNKCIDLAEFNCLGSDNYNYDNVETLANHLSLQLQLLEKCGYTILYLQPSDIVKVRFKGAGVDAHAGAGADAHADCREICLYLLVDLMQLVPLSKQDSNQLVLNYPVVYPFPKGVCAPELYKLNVLPFITPRSASYYSLGLLCLHLLPKHLSLNNLRDTPLFYFLERCLKEEPLERICLFI